MLIREYKTEDKLQCLELFKSNCPLFFDKSEYDLFENWLNHQTNDTIEYQSPTYSNSEKDAYYVLELPEIGIMGCGGFYILKDENEARMAWGMVHSKYHTKGYGKKLFNYRKAMISKDWPNYTITLGTSQHTFVFYEKMGMQVIETTKDGYGKGLDRYDMSIK